MNYTKYLSSFIVALTLCLSLTGCYDDSVLKEQYKDLESRVTELERIANQLNTNVTALQTIVNALQEKDYVTSVAPINEGSKVIGYTITFSQSGTVTIYHGKNGEDGKNGIDGYAPIIGVAQDADKQWYWTIDGTWMLDGKGNKVRASAQDGKDGKDGAPGSPGITPQLKIVDGFWYVSYDGGATWEEETLGQATGDKGYTMFAEVTYDEYYLYITMSDGEVLSIPRTPSDENNDNQVGPIQITLTEIVTSNDGASSNIIFIGTIRDGNAISYIEEIAIFYKEASEPFSIISAEKAATSEINSDNTISINITVPYNTSYNYCVYVKSQGVEYYSNVYTFTSLSPIDLSSSATANSYIVTNKGLYQFKARKGNSNTSIDGVSTVSVLWESFGTSTAPNVGDLIQKVSYFNGDIIFQTADSFKEGNAVVAAKDKEGNILWSWHIWLTDQPKEQIYYNNAGTMMDRNLGATSATPGDVCALGLMYQWGRKDPFLGSSSISENTIATSTISWPKDVVSNESTGSINYSIANPTIYITKNDRNYDWYYSGDNSTDDTRWQSTKTIYDPCPAGWRVPNDGENGIWRTAAGLGLEYFCSYDSNNKGINFSGKFGDDTQIWYPATGYLNTYARVLSRVGKSGMYWSVTNLNRDVSNFVINSNDGGRVASASCYRASGYPVRCVKE